MITSYDNILQIWLNNKQHYSNSNRNFAHLGITSQALIIGYHAEYDPIELERDFLRAQA